MADQPEVRDEMDEVSVLLALPELTRQSVAMLALAAQQMESESRKELSAFLRSMSQSQRIKPEHRDYISCCGSMLDAARLDDETGDLLRVLGWE